MARFMKPQTPSDTLRCPPQQAEEGIIDFTKPWEHSNIVFIVQGQKVFANKMILSMNSPVMKAMFESDFRERNAKEIELPEKNLDTFLLLMKALHHQDQLTEKTCDPVIPLIHEYQMIHLLSLCEELLLHGSPSVSRLLLADKYGLTKLRKRCMMHVKTIALNQLMMMKMYKEMEPTSKCEVLEHHAYVLSHRNMELNSRLSNIGNICEGELRYQQDCSMQFNRYVHEVGTEEECLECNKFLLAEISEIVKSPVY